MGTNSQPLFMVKKLLLCRDLFAYYGGWIALPTNS